MSLLFYRNKYINLLPPFLFVTARVRERESEGSRNKVHFRAQTSSGEVRQNERLQVASDTHQNFTPLKYFLLSTSSPRFPTRKTAKKFAPYLIPGTVFLLSPFFFFHIPVCVSRSHNDLSLSPLNAQGDIFSKSDLDDFTHARTHTLKQLPLSLDSRPGVR